MKPTLLVVALLSLVMPHPVTAQPSNEATEPAIDGPGVIDLLAGGTMDAWKAPSARWQVKDGNQVFHQDHWNRLTQRARGYRLEYWINGNKGMDYQDHDANGSLEGIIGFQIHNESVMQVEDKNIHILSLRS